MHVKYEEGVEVLIPARITYVDSDRKGMIYGVESDFYTGITYCRDSDIASVNGRHVRGIVPEAVIEEAEREIRKERSKAWYEAHKPTPATKKEPEPEAEKEIAKELSAEPAEPTDTVDAAPLPSPAAEEPEGTPEEAPEDTYGIHDFVSCLLDDAS